MAETSDNAPQAPTAATEYDPYRLKDYDCDFLPIDGGKAPEPKTAEPSTYHYNRIYVSNLPFTFRESDLSDLFGRFGVVVSTMIVCNERGSKGFGFVTMDSVESCERARLALHGTRILGREIEVRKATPLQKPPRNITKRCGGHPLHPKQPKAQQQQIVPSMTVATSPADLMQLNQQLISRALAENPVLLQSLLTGMRTQQTLPLYPLHPQMPMLQQTNLAYTLASLHTQFPYSNANLLGTPLVANEVPQLSSASRTNSLLAALPTQMLQVQENIMNMLGPQYFQNGVLNSLTQMSPLSSFPGMELLDATGRKRRSSEGRSAPEKHLRL